MGKLEYMLLDLNDPDAVEQYERCLFRAFYPLDNPVLARLRKVDMVQRRMRLCIPYRDMDVFIARFDGRIIAGAAINYNCYAPMQLEKIGFTIDKSRPGICEGLAIFNTRSFAEQHPVMFELGAYIHAELLRKKIRVTYGTCSTRLLKGYTLLGFREVDHRNLDTYKIHLLEKTVDSPESGFTIAAGRPFRDRQTGGQYPAK
ncbi:MAG: hypothetical protein JW863_17595 [Chitinispirillaceae bacterium]|nr:hypothetical protein [Chitinispirillaceae bacterium]